MQYRHRNPKIEIEMESEDFSTLNDVFDSDIEYSQVAYEVDHAEDWDDTNVNLDFATPHREDYTVFLPSHSLVWGDTDWDADTGSWDGTTLDGTDTVRASVNITDSYVIKEGLAYTFVISYTSLKKEYGIRDSIIVTIGSETWGTNLRGYDREGTITITATPTVTAIDPQILVYFHSTEVRFNVKITDVTVTPPLSTGHYTDSNGINLNAWEYHNIRMIPSLVNTDAFALRIKNKRGSLGIQALAMVAELSRFGGRDR